MQSAEFLLTHFPIGCIKSPNNKLTSIIYIRKNRSHIKLYCTATSWQRVPQLVIIISLVDYRATSSHSSHADTPNNKLLTQCFVISGSLVIDNQRRSNLATGGINVNWGSRSVASIPGEGAIAPPISNTRARVSFYMNTRIYTRYKSKNRGCFWWRSDSLFLPVVFCIAVRRSCNFDWIVACCFCAYVTSSIETCLNEWNADMNSYLCARIKQLFV